LLADRHLRSTGTFTSLQNDVNSTLNSNTITVERTSYLLADRHLRSTGTFTSLQNDVDYCAPPERTLQENLQNDGGAHLSKFQVESAHLLGADSGRNSQKSALLSLIEQTG